MKKCPICHKRFDNTYNICSECHTLLDTIEELELPKTKEQLAQELKKDNERFNQEKTVQIVNLNEIPLTIDEKQIIEKQLKKETKKQKKNIALTTIQVSCIFFLLILSIYIIKATLTSPQTSKTITKISSTITNEETITGNWITNKGNLYIFNKDNTFYWYENYKVLNNNFYTGTYSYKNSNEALVEMGYTEEDYTSTFKEKNIKLDNIYSIKIEINNEFINNITKPKTTTWWIIMVIENNKKATIYNKTLDVRYILNKR
jgi:hypothetical protein